MVFIAKSQPLTETPVEGRSAPPSSLETTLQAAREHARRLTQMYGVDSPDVAVAWDAVEELLTARSRQRAQEPTAFERYCALYPDAPECRIYED